MPSRLLFNDNIPVSQNDIKKWLDQIPNLSKSDFRREAYRKAYDIDNKIRQAKINNNWPKILE